MSGPKAFAEAGITPGRRRHVRDVRLVHLHRARRARGPRLRAEGRGRRRSSPERQPAARRRAADQHRRRRTVGDASRHARPVPVVRSDPAAARRGGRRAGAGRRDRGRARQRRLAVDAGHGRARNGAEHERPSRQRAPTGRRRRSTCGRARRPKTASSGRARGAASCASSAARRCGLHQHYPRMLCSHCGADDVEWVTASGLGTVYSFTVSARTVCRRSTSGCRSWSRPSISTKPARGCSRRCRRSRRSDAEIGMRVRAAFRPADDEFGFVDFDPLSSRSDVSMARAPLVDPTRARRAPARQARAQTRRRLLDATARLLETHGIRDLRVVDIARAVGTSPATFYQYFRDVEEAVLALAAEVGDELAPLARLLDRPWDGERRTRRCARAGRRLRRATGTGTAPCCGPATSRRRRATRASARFATGR